MAHTPNSTPLRDYDYSNYQFEDTFQNKKLPLIVDIAIDNNGKQLYQVHESSKLIRKEMPRSTNFDQNLDEEIFNKTPIRKVLGTISPTSQRKSYDYGLFEQKFDDNKSDNLFQDSYEPESIEELAQSQASASQDNDIWSDDVENAFEEVLKIIPKNGLNKIKISGRSCGRNELISDYILNKTGKFRTRKQVSSHIQVIKNLGQKLHIIKLINQGPVFKSNEDQIENIKKFEEIFSKINLNKSLGFNDDGLKNLKRRNSFSSPFPSKRGRRLGTNKFLKIVISNFLMNITDEYNLNPIYITMQDDKQELRSLRLNDNANITTRFPGLNDFQNCIKIPILHNMVKMLFPTNLPYNYSIETGFKSNFVLSDKVSSPTIPDSSPIKLKSYNLFTCVYSYGNEVIKFNEEGIKLNEDHLFLAKFWKFFFNKFLSKEESESNTAVKGLTIKQIIYEKDGNNSSNKDINLVPKLKIKMVLLWEFAKVNEFKDAITTTTKLILPPKPETEIMPGEDQRYGDFSAPVTSITSPHINATGTVKYEDNGSILTHTTLPRGIQSAPGSFTDYNKPQLNIQRKFQNLQQQQHVQHRQQVHLGNQYPYGSPVSVSGGYPLQMVNQPIPMTNVQNQHQVIMPPYIGPAAGQFNYTPQTASSNVDLTMVSTHDGQDYQFGGLLYPDGLNEF